MRVYATREFSKFAAKEGIADEALCDAIVRAENGLIDASLAGQLIKQRSREPAKENREVIGQS